MINLNFKPITRLPIFIFVILVFIFQNYNLGYTTMKENKIDKPVNRILSWKDYSSFDDFEKTKYFFDDEYLGQGAEGFKVVLNEIDNMPNNSILTIRSEILLFESSGSKDYMETFPFSQNKELKEIFMHLIEKKNISIHFSFNEGGE